jgi:hypothetical protein
MCFNLGIADRILRTVLGVALIAYGMVTPNYIVAAIGLIPLLTAVFGLCPFYLLFKLNTGCKRDSEGQ